MSRTQRPLEGRTNGADKVPAVNKALAIVRHLNRASSSGVSLNEIANNLEITKSHCHNILKTLTSEGWLIYDPERRSYSLAHRLLTDISRLLTRQSPSLLIHDELVRLSRATRLPCVLTRVERDGSFVAIDKAEEAAELDRICADRPSLSPGRTRADARAAGMDARGLAQAGARPLAAQGLHRHDGHQEA